MLKKTLLVGAASFFLISTAQAADFEAPPAVYDWTGPYVGLQGGYAWGKNDSDFDEGLTGLIPLSTDSLDADGFVGGGHIGYLFQPGSSFVYGVEADLEYADLSDDVTIFREDVPPTDIGDLSKDIDWLASLRLRAGFAMDRTLLYATGGVAVGGVELEASFDPAVTDYGDESEKGTEWGWTIGGGVEHAFTDELSLRLEYRYTDLGKTDIDVVSGGDVNRGEVKNRFHAVRAGLSWHFGGI